MLLTAKRSRSEPSPLPTTLHADPVQQAVKIRDVLPGLEVLNEEYSRLGPSNFKRLRTALG